MRFSLRVLILATLLIVLVPAVVYAGGPFYTSPDGRPNGSGTVSDPRQAFDEGGVQVACRYFYNNKPGAVGAKVFWYEADSIGYCKYKIKSNGTCIRKGCPDAPVPGTGVDLPPPVIIGGLITLGLLLFGASWLLRRHKQRSV